MIFLFTDFGTNDLYAGQLNAAIAKIEPSIIIIDLFHNAPQFDVFSSSILLKSLLNGIPENSIILGVVDPGVGSEQRKPIVLKTRSHIFVGPDNGLFDFVCSTDETSEVYEITWRPESLSNSFHARDLFAPIAGLIHEGESLGKLGKPFIKKPIETEEQSLNRIIYIDSFGNCFTGLNLSLLSIGQSILCENQLIAYASVFSEVAVGELFWYENSIGLIEIAANQASAQKILDLKVGNVFTIK